MFFSVSFFRLIIYSMVASEMANQQLVQIEVAIIGNREKRDFTIALVTRSIQLLRLFHIFSYLLQKKAL